MTTTNTSQTSANATFVVNASNGEINLMVANKKEEEKTKQAQPVSGFAKNTRYSIYNNGGGYTGL